MLLELHGVKGDEGAEPAAELLHTRMPLSLVVLKQALVRARVAALRAVEGQVCPIMGLHVCSGPEKAATGVMPTIHGLEPVYLSHVFPELLVV